MATTIFLAICAAIWLPYGLYLSFDPAYLDGVAGVAASSTTGTIELRAMYGGLQAAIGALALASLWRPSLRHPASVCVGFLCAGLALARGLGAALDAELSAYTLFALGLEIAAVAYAALLLRATGEPSAA